MATLLRAAALTLAAKEAAASTALLLGLTAQSGAVTLTQANIGDFRVAPRRSALGRRLAAWDPLQRDTLATRHENSSNIDVVAPV